jgi:hypothetical protein
MPAQREDGKTVLSLRAAFALVAEDDLFVPEATLTFPSLSRE